MDRLALAAKALLEQVGDSLPHAAFEVAELRSALAAEQRGEAPGHTDLMVTPESVGAFLDAHPTPPPPASAEDGAGALRSLLEKAHDAGRERERGRDDADNHGIPPESRRRMDVDRILAEAAPGRVYDATKAHPAPADAGAVREACAKVADRWADEANEDVRKWSFERGGAEAAAMFARASALAGRQIASEIRAGRTA